MTGDTEGGLGWFPHKTQRKETPNPGAASCALLSCFPALSLWSCPLTPGTAGVPRSPVGLVLCLKLFRIPRKHSVWMWIFSPPGCASAAWSHWTLMPHAGENAEVCAVLMLPCSWSLAPHCGICLQHLHLGPPCLPAGCGAEGRGRFCFLAGLVCLAPCNRAQSRRSVSTWGWPSPQAVLNTWVLAAQGDSWVLQESSTAAPVAWTRPHLSSACFSV